MKNSTKYIILNLCIFRISLELLYVICIIPSYKYYGFVININPNKYLISWILFITLSIIIKAIITLPIKASNIVVLSLFIMSFIPSSSLYGLNSLPDKFYIYIVLYWIMILILEKLINKRKNRYGKNNIFERHQKIKTISLEIITGVFCVYVFFVSLVYNGLYVNYNFSNIYEIRYNAAQRNFGAFSGYLLVWAAVVLAFSAVRYFQQRKWILFALICYIQLLLFSINGMKTTLLFIPIGLIGYLYFSNKRISIIPLALALLNILAILVYVFLHNVIIAFLTGFRLYYLPALLNFQFYEYFSENKPDMLRQSILRWIGVRSQYDIPIPYLINSVYGDGTASANTGMFGDAFSNFGPFGIILYPILLIGILAILNYSTIRLEMKSYIAIIVIITIAFTNCAFFTVLLTNGLLISIIMLMLHKRTKNIDGSS